MEWTQYILPVALGLGIGFLVLLYRNTDYTSIKIISKTDFVNNMRRGQLVDIRSKEDFEKGKIAGARNFKVNQIAATKSKIRRDLSTFIYCDNGRKSHRAAKKMTKKGFRNIYVLANGYKGYIEAK